MIINLSFIIIDILLLLFIFDSFIFSSSTKKKKIKSQLYTSSNSTLNSSIGLNNKKQFMSTSKGFESSSDSTQNVSYFSSQPETNNIEIPYANYKLSDSNIKNSTPKKHKDESIVDTLKKQNVFFRIQAQLNQRNLVSAVDDLYAQFPKDNCKRLVVIPYQKNIQSYEFYFLSDLKKFYEANVCTDMYHNLDMLVQFPRITSMFSGSLLEWVNLQLENYQEIYFIMDTFDYDQWKKTPTIDIVQKAPTLPVLNSLVQHSLPETFI